MKQWVAVVLFSLFASPLWAAEIEGVAIPEQVVVDGRNLQLNGAGVRTKFFIDIYVGALYLPRMTSSVEQAIAGEPPKRITMHVLYDSIDHEKLVAGWLAGFEKNQSEKALAKLKSRLDRFNAMFVDARQGDMLAFDFLTDGSTVVIQQGKQSGRIEGFDFQQALLRVWLGEKPADRDLKKAMLRQE